MQPAIYCLFSAIAVVGSLVAMLAFLAAGNSIGGALSWALLVLSLTGVIHFGRRAH